MTIKNSSQKVRFIGVGVINTIIDFGLLFLLRSIGLPTITSNVISTTTAFIFSFFANKKYTFKTTDTNIKREVTLFILVTLFGLWVLQTIVIQISTNLLHPAHLSADVTLFIAKLCATIVSLVWNYIFYSRIVFKQKDIPTTVI